MISIKLRQTLDLIAIWFTLKHLITKNQFSVYNQILN